MSQQNALSELLTIMARLRDPKTGCPWDVKQDFKSIVPHTIEEAYEVADCIERGDFSELKTELGDLLFQVIFYAQLGKEQGLFDFHDIVQGLNDKLIRRHPHIFAQQQNLTDEQIAQQWQAIKAQERIEKANNAPPSLWQDIPANLPSLSKAKKIQRRVAGLGFDWPSYHGALDKVAEEVDEVKEALAVDPYSAHSAEEVGDLLFATVNVARHIKRDPEQLLRAANDKFSVRFEKVQAYLTERGQSLDTATLEQMDAAWEAIKKPV